MESCRLLFFCFTLCPILEIYGVGAIGKLVLLVLMFNRFLEKFFIMGLTFDSRYM